MVFPMGIPREAAAWLLISTEPRSHGHPSGTTSFAEGASVPTGSQQADSSFQLMGAVCLPTNEVLESYHAVFAFVSTSPQPCRGVSKVIGARQSIYKAPIRVAPAGSAHGERGIV